MKNYHISVTCSDTTTFSQIIFDKTKKEANAFCDGIKSLYEQQGKNIFMFNVKISKY